MVSASPQQHAAVLRRVALRAVEEARAAWKAADKMPTEARVRTAFRACVFADRALRQVSAVTPNESPQMLAQAARILQVAGRLRAQLVRMDPARPAPL